MLKINFEKYSPGWQGKVFWWQGSRTQLQALPKNLQVAPQGQDGAGRAAGGALQTEDTEGLTSSWASSGQPSLEGSEWGVWGQVCPRQGQPGGHGKGGCDGETREDTPRHTETGQAWGQEGTSQSSRVRGERTRKRDVMEGELMLYNLHILKVPSVWVRGRHSSCRS